ncbi:conjugal transfer protein TraN (plasmid) [Burkholderia thailandensis]|uniref:conjugal transfer protein TraN n=1 Tax=Burkholderia thailandensis TaxID=57975 RepID=UPI00192D7D9E|nr:conjugal transfer protein TraN [Burkholderia thailandensis]MBS2132333.1 conjugal transfer protein TraN [Burkholderia thailandensis]QRA15140.1 conjugal transfer protein TraN [Burkholderia thailandensis]
MKALLAMMLAAFAQIAAATPTCQLTAETCVDPGGTRVINGVSIYQDCWNYQDTYQCQSPSTVNDCATLQQQGCGMVGQQCISYNDAAPSVCDTYQYTYQCVDTPAHTNTVTQCTNTLCAPGAGCFSTSSSPDNGVGAVVTGMETGREAGAYGVGGGNVDIFKGYDESCSIKVFGGAEIKSCCTSSSGGQGFTNNAISSAAVQAGMSAAGTGAKDAIALGSKYVYDELYQTVDSSLVNEGLGQMGSWADSVLSSSGSFGAYGFEFSFSMTDGLQFVEFNPYAFAAAVAIQLIQSWLTCTQDEQTLSLKRGQNLCVQFNQYCSSKVLGVCIEEKKEYCCFNSLIAKIVNQQGKAQLGIPFAGCSGLTADQLQTIDFSKIDFSEFVSSIQSNSVDQNAILNQIQQQVSTGKGASQ